MIKTKEASLLFQSYFYHLDFLTFKLYIIKSRGIFTTSVEKKGYGRLLEDKNNREEILRKKIGLLILRTENF